jgi:hypothetical protein
MDRCPVAPHALSRERMSRRFQSALRSKPQRLFEAAYLRIVTAGIFMERQPRWAETCARILQQCEALKGGREKLAAFLGVHPHDLALWLAARAGPPRAVFEKAMELILEEHDRRAKLEEQMGPRPQRRRSDLDR